jgi:stress-induced morphogen
MFAIDISSEAFKGLTQLQMQRRVNAVIKELMDEGGWHGVRVNCRVG